MMVDFDQLFTETVLSVGDPVGIAGIQNDAEGIHVHCVRNLRILRAQKGQIIRVLVVDEVNLFLRPGQPQDLPQALGGADAVAVTADMAEQHDAPVLPDFRQNGFHNFSVHTPSPAMASRSASIRMASSLVFTVAPLAFA